MNAARLRLDAPLPPFTPGFFVFPWGKQTCFPVFRSYEGGIDREGSELRGIDWPPWG